MLLMVPVMTLRFTDNSWMLHFSHPLVVEFEADNCSENLSLTISYVRFV